MREPIQIFIAYSRKDTSFLEELRTHLNPLERSQMVTIWYDGKIEPGSVWEDDIKAHLHDSDIILLLVSADAISSDYFYEKEVADALARHHAGKARVIPLIIRPCAWQATPLGRLQALPRDGQAVTTWADHDQAFADAIETLWIVIEQMISGQEVQRDHTLVQPKVLFPNAAISQQTAESVAAKKEKKPLIQIGGRSLKEWLWSPIGIVLLIAVFFLGIVNADRIRSFYFTQRYYPAELELEDVDVQPYLDICEDSPPEERFMCSLEAIRERLANIPPFDNPFHETGEVLEFEVIYTIWWNGDVYEEFMMEDIGLCGQLVTDQLLSWPVPWVPARKDGKKTACRIHLRYRCSPEGVELL